MSSTPKPIEIFVSYSHKDEKWRKRLVDHLRNLEYQGIIVWHDRKIGPGTEWEQEIDKHLNTSNLILLLISSNFMGSDYCWGTEMMRAMERHRGGEARVIPISLYPYDIKDAPFAKLQALPTNGKPVSGWKNSHEAFMNIAQGIRKAIKDLTANQSLDSTPLIDTIEVNPSSSKEEEKSANNEGLNSTPSDNSTPVNTNTVPGKVWNVPYSRNSFFTGRDEILNDLHAAFKADVTRAQAITGLGGIGKTQIAIEYAYRYRDDYQTILWANAGSPEVLDSGFAAIAELLKLQAGKDMQDQNIVVGGVKHWLEESKAWLLILDNIEDLASVHKFIPQAASEHIILITTAHATGTVAQGHEVKEMEETSSNDA